MADHPERAAILATIAAVIKPQLGNPRSDPGRRPAQAPPHRPAPARPARAEGAAARPAASARVRSGSSPAGCSPWRTAALLSAPFGLSIDRPARPGRQDGRGYPYITVNAYNPWALIEQARQRPGGRRHLAARYRQLDRTRHTGDDPGHPGPVRWHGLAAGGDPAGQRGRRPARRPAHGAGRADGPGDRLLRGPDPRPRALPVPVLRPRRDPGRDLVPLAAGLFRAGPGQLRQPVRGPDHALLPTTRGSATGWAPADDVPLPGGGHDRGPGPPGRSGCGRSPSCGGAPRSGSTPKSRGRRSTGAVRTARPDRAAAEPADEVPSPRRSAAGRAPRFCRS